MAFRLTHALPSVNTEAVMAARIIRLCLECSCRLRIRLWNASSAYITFYVSEVFLLIFRLLSWHLLGKAGFGHYLLML